MFVTDVSLEVDVEKFDGLIMLENPRNHMKN